MNIIDKLNKTDDFWQIIPKIKESDLIKIIKLASHYYYNKSSPLITDEIYDALLEKLKKINPNAAILKEVGAPPSGEAVELPYKLGSMDKIKDDIKILEKWKSNFFGPYIISDKLDGVSCLAVMKSGNLRLYTRGNITHGRDITHLLKYINNISLNNIPISNKCIAIRGELMISKKNFGKFETIRSSARTTVIGIVVSKESKIIKKIAKTIEFIAYEIIEPYYIPSKQFSKLKLWNITTAYNKKVADISIPGLDKLFKNRMITALYDIDGIIVSDDNKHSRKFSKNPPYSFAYKGISSTLDVTVLEIIWNPSKDGYLIPKVKYSPIKLSQAILEKAAGFNAKYIVDNKLGPGAVITIIRSGEVIPHILHIVKSAKTPSMPTGYDYHWDDNVVNIILDNPNNDDMVRVQRLTRFVTQINVKYMSKGIITKLVNNGFNTMKKILTMTVVDLESIDGIKKTLATKLYQSIRTAIDELTMVKLMSASNIFGRGFGETRIEKILEAYPNIINKYKKSQKNKWIENIVNIDGFDTKTATNFIEKLSEFQTFYKSLSGIISITSKPRKNTGIFSDMNLVFTGFTGNEWKDFIISNGGKISSSVTKNTTILVYLDLNSSSGKMTAADKLGIKKMSKSNFAKKYHLP